MIGNGASCKLHGTAQKSIYASHSWFGKQRIRCSPYVSAAAANSTSKGRTLSRIKSFSALTRREKSMTRTSFGSTYDFNVRMGEFGRRGDVVAARKLFDNMPERDKVSYASMVSIYLKHDEFHRAEKLFYEIPAGMRCIVVDSAMVRAYAMAGRVDRAQQIFDEMPDRNAFSWSSLISGYFEIGEVNRALELFGQMPESQKNVITWTKVITGLGRNGLVDRARVAFDQMPVKTVVSWTSMVNAYIENGRVDDAFRLFHMMPEHNLYSWNIMIHGLLNQNRVYEAKNLFDLMPWRNAISWTTMVTGLARNGVLELARRYFDQMPNKDVSAWNAMITAYADEGRMGEASELFKLIPSRNIVTWNALIDGYAKGQHNAEVFGHFILLLCSGIRPNEKSLTSLLTACRGLLEVLQAHGLVMRLGFDVETTLANTLITMYYRCGDVTSAWIAFDYLECRDVVSWTAMILAYSNHGFGKQALQTFSKMLRAGNDPDEVTFVGVLSACSHAGLVQKGQMLFDSMRAYGLEPMPEHYSCLVDILGRAGLVNEAVKVIHEMPRDKYDAVVLGALLGSCCLHGDDGLADKIGDELIELEPANSGGYVLLARVYAASGKWDKFSELRKKMKEREVKKVPGISEIQVDGQSHVFFVCDKSHPDIERIYTLLQEQLLHHMEDTEDPPAIL